MPQPTMLLLLCMPPLPTMPLHLLITRRKSLSPTPTSMELLMTTQTQTSMLLSPLTLLVP